MCIFESWLEENDTFDQVIIFADISFYNDPIERVFFCIDTCGEFAVIVF